MSLYTIDEIRNKLKPIAVKYQLPKIYLFGSYARGDATENSDLDLLLDISGSNVKGMIFCELDDELTEAFGKVDILTTRALSQYTDYESDINFNKKIMNERILVYER